MKMRGCRKASPILMANYILNRQPSTPDGTFGALTDADGNKICVTCELPWLDNEPRKSCIPLGVYPCIPHNSMAHPDTWEVTNVPGRSEILLHNGNIDTQSAGCILVGDSFGTLNGKPAVLNSVATLKKLRGILPDKFQLTVN